MDQHKLESIIFSLTLEKENFLRDLDVLEEMLDDETRSKDERADLREEREHLIDAIKEVDLDIGVYQEMMDKLAFTEICYENTDGGYESRYEVLMEGDY